MPSSVAVKIAVEASSAVFSRASMLLENVTVYDMLEIVEARCHKSTIFCTQYESEGWYTRIDPNSESDSPVSEAIMDRIIHNAYEVLVDGRVSMRERKGLKAAREGGGKDV